MSVSSDDQAPALTHPGMPVPPTVISGPLSTDPQLDAVQQRFYDDHFRPAFLSGAPIDVGNAVGYVHKLWFELATGLGSDAEAPREIRRLLQAYGPSWEVADTYFLEGNFEAGYAEWGVRVPQNLYVNLAATLGHPRLSAVTVLWWSDFHITKRGIRGRGDVMDRLQEGLDTFHDAHGTSVIEDFWDRLTADAVTNETLEEIITIAPGEMSREEVRQALADAPAAGAGQAIAFRGNAGIERPIEWPQPWTEPGVRWHLLREKCRQLVRSAENDHRADAGIPLVGQGWVSEMALLREMQAAFPDEVIVHQARPGWLGRQSLDIFFPDRMVAIEYQGAQHSRPVEFFGGDAAFEEQLERDATKRTLCAAVDCTLIEVFPDYRITDLVDTVAQALTRARD